jgi:hypothetical protein
MKQKGEPMPKYTQVEIAKAICDSILNTYSKYNKDSPYNPVEYEIMDGIVNDLTNRIAGDIDHEHNIDKILHEANAIGEWTSEIRPSGWGDILIRGENGKPEVIIELKTERGFGTYKKDIERIRDILLVNPAGASFKYGLMAFAIWRDLQSVNSSLTPAQFTRQNMIGFCRDVRTEAERAIDGKLCVVPLIYPEELKVVDRKESAWSVVCVAIEPFFGSRYLGS